jgi:hypothetical protein
MTTQSMNSFGFYMDVTALNSDLHRELKFDPAKFNFNFAKTSNAAFLSTIEFVEAAKEYPIVFTRDPNGVISPSVLLGAENFQNLFVDEEGKWDADYIPAFIRRYPFIMSKTDNPNDPMVLCFDRECPAVDRSTGDILINEVGGVTPKTQEILTFFENVQKEVDRTIALMKQLDDMNLFVPRSITFTTSSGENCILNGLYMINEEIFSEIPMHKLQEIFKSGALSMCFMHFSSLTNIPKLANRLDILQKSKKNE